MAKSLQAKTMHCQLAGTSALARVRVRAQHMEREAGAGLRTLARPAEEEPWQRGWSSEPWWRGVMVRWGGVGSRGDEGEANLGSEQCRRGGAARSERRGGRCEEGRQSHCRPNQYTLETIEAAHNHLTNQSEHVLA